MSSYRYLMEQESDIINTLHQLNRDAILEALQQLLSSIASQKHYVLHETNQMICRIQMISQQILETLKPDLPEARIRNRQTLEVPISSRLGAAITSTL